jgi:hypothetical protein
MAGSDPDALASRLQTSIANLDDYIERRAVHIATERVADAERRAAEAEQRMRDSGVEQFQDLLGSIWLYISWPYVTKQLTTPQKELFADAVEAWSRRLNDGDPDEPTTVDRWWRA